MIEIILLSLAGLVGGLLLSFWLIGQLMARPTTRIWMSDWINWSNNELPEGTYQLVRHGKWIASAAEEDKP